VSLVRKQEPNPATAGVVQYHVYDIPSFEGTFFQRAPVYNAMLQGFSSIVPVQTRIAFNQAMFDKDYEEFMEDGYEGQMGREDADYEIGKRSAHLQKRKEFQDAEFPLTAIGEGLGNWSGHAKWVEFMLPNDARLENGERPRAGIKGTKEFCKQLLDEAEEWIGGKSTSTIQFFQLSARGIPRFPVATKFHKAGARM
jgi:DNA ligase-1